MNRVEINIAQCKTDLCKFAWDYSKNAMCLLNDEFSIIKVNKAFCKLFSIPDKYSETIEKPLLTTSFPGIYQVLKKNITFNGSPKVSYLRTLSVSGKRFLLQNDIVRITDDQSNTFYLWSIEDKSEYTEIKESLSKKYNDLAITLKYMADGLITISPNKLIQMMNNEAERLTGWKKVNLTNRTIDTIFVLEDKINGNEISIPFTKLFTSAKLDSLINDAILVSRTGLRTHISYSINQIKNEYNQILGLAITFRDITEDDKKRQLLQESEARFAKVFQSKLAAISFTDPTTGIFISVNDRFLELTEYSREEILNHDAIELNLWVNPEDRNNFINLISVWGKVIEMEANFLSKNGFIKTVLISSELIYSGDSSILLTMLTDITDKKKIHTELILSKTQLAAALEIANLGHWEYDVINDIFYTNDQFYKILKTSSKEMNGYVFSAEVYLNKFVHPSDKDFVRNYFVNAIKNKLQIDSFELEHRTKFDDESVGIIAIRFFIVKNGLGKSEKAYGIVQDITKQKQYEKNLISEKEELDVALYNIRDGVISTDVDDCIVLTNKAVTDITGWKKEELIGISIIDFFEMLHADFSSLAGKSKISTIFGMNEVGNEQSSEAMEIETKQGSKKIIFSTSAPVKTVTNDLKGFIYILKDITEQVKMETQLHVSQKMEAVGQLAAGIAHEINTPMQYILDNTLFVKDSFKQVSDYIKIIESDKVLIENNNLISSKRSEIDLDYILSEVPEAIKQTEVGIQRVSKIVLAMKDFSHHGQNEKIMADINRGIEVTATISKNEWKYYADLELKLAENLPQVYCNIDEINQVVLNMIVNAAHAIQEKQIKNNINEKGKIVISTYATMKEVIIEITDTGNGIPPHIKEKIFDPFFTTKEVGKGSGQGLAIAHNIIIKNHQGSIFVDSVPGVGTTFNIQLPIDKR